MAGDNGICFDVVVNVESELHIGSNQLSVYIYDTRSSDDTKTLVNLRKKYVRILFRDDHGEVMLRFKSILDMLDFAEALYYTILAMILYDNNKYPIIEKLGEFLRVTM